MKNAYLIMIPLLAAFAASPVFAKDKPDRNDRGNGRGNGAQADAPAARGHADRGHADRNHAGRPAGHGDNGLHLGWYKQQWRRGDRIEVAHIEPTYYIDDYARYELRQPPEGHRWVRPVDGRYILIQITSGLIVDALGY